MVESVAYCVCASLGLDTAGDSVPYLAGWGGEEASDAIEAYAAADRPPRRRHRGRTRQSHPKEETR